MPYFAVRLKPYTGWMAKTGRLELRITSELLGRVDAARGDVSRTRFVERALEAALGLPSRVTSVRVDRVLKDTPAEVRGEREPTEKPKPAAPVRRAREFVLDPRQAALNKAKKP